MPPYGGYGGNTGIHDVHNLAWKLAAVLEGRASPELLATYDPERRPIARFTTEQAYGRYVTRAAPYLMPKGVEPVVGDPEIDLGTRVRSRAVITEDGDDEAVYIDPREARGRPGTRAPHVWLARAGGRVSTIDLVGERFALLCGPEADAWAQAGAAAGLDVHRIGGGGDLEDPDDAFLDAYGLTPRGAALVRPDAVVAWRTPGGDGAASGALQDVLDTVLCRASLVS
jgi:hypothetical protein